jgi:hypothetical protein
MEGEKKWGLVVVVGAAGKKNKKTKTKQRNTSTLKA